MAERIKRLGKMSESNRKVRITNRTLQRVYTRVRDLLDEGVKPDNIIVSVREGKKSTNPNPVPAPDPSPGPVPNPVPDPASIAPPIGLRPEYVWLHSRAREIEEACWRYVEARWTIPLEWLVELGKVRGQLDLATKSYPDTDSKPIPVTTWSRCPQCQLMVGGRTQTSADSALLQHRKTAHPGTFLKEGS